MKLVRESISFERGHDPKYSMDLGIKTWDKIKPGDLFVLRGPKCYLDKPKGYPYLWNRMVYMVVEVYKRGNNIELAYWACLGVNTALETRKGVKAGVISLGRTPIKGTRDQFEKTFKILQKEDEENYES